MNSILDKGPYVLGVNGGFRPGYKDVSAVLMQNGQVVAAVEEERFTRVKHQRGQLPVLSIREVLRVGEITIEDVAVVAFHGVTWGPDAPQRLRRHFVHYFGNCPPIEQFHHHDCHAASAYFPSGFEPALIMSVDGSGDGVSTQISIGRENSIVTLKRFDRPQSLGFYFSIFTQICGFNRDADEYKLMGLAAYGDSSKFELGKILSLRNDEYHLNEEILFQIRRGEPLPLPMEMLFDDSLCETLGIPRRSGTDMAQAYMDLAASAQRKLEEALIHLAREWIARTGISKLALAGGVALNCLANSRIEDLPEVSELFVQPASSDAGISLGAAYLASVKLGVKTFEKQTHTFFGNSYSQQDIENVIRLCGLAVHRANNLIESAAADLNANKVVGWFQGKMEFGPRALGNRSILASPGMEDVQRVVNEKVKFRESFRPFGATVLEEDFNRYFEAQCADAPYMTKVFPVREEYRRILRGVTHKDGTCRVQTINREQNPIYYSLLMAFREISGLGVLLNTSFNLSHEPIVSTPREAIASFFASGLDVLYLGECELRK